jgi:hypothetical protein
VNNQRESYLTVCLLNTKKSGEVLGLTICFNLSPHLLRIVLDNLLYRHKLLQIVITFVTFLGNAVRK